MINAIHKELTLYHSNAFCIDELNLSPPSARSLNLMADMNRKTSDWALMKYQDMQRPNKADECHNKYHVNFLTVTGTCIMDFRNT